MTRGHEKLDVYRLSMAKEAENERLNWIVSPRYSVAWVEEVIASRKTPNVTNKKNSIPIPISIPMKSKPISPGTANRALDFDDVAITF